MVMARVKQIDEQGTGRVLEYAAEILGADGLAQLQDGYGLEIVCARLRIGRFRPNSGSGDLELVVPTWALEAGEDYALYYTAHELAHVYQWIENPASRLNHTKLFYSQFMRLCPESVQHFELKYKPKLARAAGIRPAGQATNKLNKNL